MTKRIGFGLLELIFAVGLVALLAGGGLYAKELAQKQSAIEIGNSALKQAEELKQAINKRAEDQAKQLESFGVPVQPTAVPTPAPSTMGSSTALTATWKTYRNGQYGFEVKYPADWEISENKDGVEVQFWNETENMWESITFEAYIPSDAISPSAIEGDEQILSHSTTTIGGVSAEQIVWGESGKATGIHIVVVRKPFAMSIWLKATHRPVIDQILSTVKFTK